MDRPESGNGINGLGDPRQQYSNTKTLAEPSRVQSKHSTRSMAVTYENIDVMKESRWLRAHDLRVFRVIRSRRISKCHVRNYARNFGYF